MLQGIWVRCLSCWRKYLLISRSGFWDLRQNSSNVCWDVTFGKSYKEVPKTLTALPRCNAWRPTVLLIRTTPWQASKMEGLWPSQTQETNFSIPNSSARSWMNFSSPTPPLDIGCCLNISLWSGKAFFANERTTTFMKDLFEQINKNSIRNRNV